MRKASTLGERGRGREKVGGGGETEVDSEVGKK